MVDKFEKILKQIIAEKGVVHIFAIVKMDELTDKWSLILSAPWSSENTFNNDFVYIRNLMLQNLSNEESSQIARIMLFTNDEHIVQSLLKYKTGTHLDESERMNGNIVHEAYILASNAVTG